VHALVITRYLPRKTRGLPRPIEVPGGLVGYAAIGRLGAHAAGASVPAPAEQAATAIVLTTFLVDLAAGVALKGRDGRASAFPLALLGLALWRRRSPGFERTCMHRR